MEPSPLTDLIDFLGHRVAICQYLEHDQLLELVDGSRIVSYEQHQAVIEFGEDVTFLGVLLDGELIASVADGGRPREVGRLKAGDTFGELALMSGDKAMSDVIATTRCHVLRVPVTLFHSLIMAQPRAVQYLSRILAERFRQLAEDPAVAAAAFRQSPDPYGLHLHTERCEKLLVFDCHADGVAYWYFNTADEAMNACGLIDRIGQADARHCMIGPHGERVHHLHIDGVQAAMQSVCDQLTSSDAAVLGDVSQLTAVGHHVMYGGQRFVEPIVVTDELLAQLETLDSLAPQHNQSNVDGIREAIRLVPDAPHVAVFETAFHHTLPSYAYLYGLPFDYYEKYAVRRYGFHGLSHWYASLAASHFLKRRPNELEIVSCHLGRGSSVCAVDHGRSIDTSMGFTPCSGLIMETRSGDVDPGALAFLQRQEQLTPEQLDRILNEQSGMLGISGIAGGIHEIERQAEAGHHRALLALKSFCYGVRKYIGAYVAAMEGLDALVFTGSVGQESPDLRSLALQGLACMGIQLDEERNRRATSVTEICRISADDSPIAVLVVPAKEQLMIARETLRAVGRSDVDRARQRQPQDAIPIEVSAHHVHLIQEHVETLFGAGHQLTPESELSQPGQFACREQVSLAGPKGRIERVRVLGPCRSATQVEIAMTEQYKLGIHAPIRESGDVKDTPGVVLEGPAGKVDLKEGVICALRHIHMTPEDALHYGVKDKSTVRVRVAGDRELIFGDVLVRVSPNYQLAMHIDTDEANAANIRTGMLGYLDGVQTEA